MQPAYQSDWATHYVGDSREVLQALPAERCQAVITSPPYYGLRAYLPDDHPDKSYEIGTEKVADCLGWATGSKCGECYIDRLVTVFDEVRRVLRQDGVCFVVIADSYSSHASGKVANPMKKSTLAGVKTQQVARAVKENQQNYRNSLLPEKNLCGIPQRFALAMQAAGWYWRSEIIWWKRNCMPGSQEDRPTVAHEQVLMFTKSAAYYWDQEAVKEPAIYADHHERYTSVRALTNYNNKNANNLTGGNHGLRGGIQDTSSRNIRTVWDIPTVPKPMSFQHYAAFPPELARRCLLASTSERGCCVGCGAPWERLLEKVGLIRQRWAPGENQYHTQAKGRHGATSAFTTDDVVVKKTIGWHPTCTCFPIIEGTEPRPQPVPCTVLDMFAGSGTVAYVAQEHFRRSISIDLNAAYLPLLQHRLKDAVLPFGIAREKGA